VGSGAGSTRAQEEKKTYARRARCSKINLEILANNV